MDRISQLPYFIIHHIVSFVNNNTWDGSPPADLVRMSVLSKTWFDLTASFPILDFYMDDFTSRESFFKYVEYTTSRFCHQDVPAHMLRLGANIREPAELDIVNRCLELVLEKGVRELVININYLSESSSSVIPKYRLPDILLSVSVLESLIICGCELPSSLMLDVVKFKSLIYLELIYVHIDDEAIKNLVTGCRLLQELHITSCHGFKKICVYGHQSLRNVRIVYDTPIERIDIEAPNLSNILIYDTVGNGAPQMNLASCKKLATVTYMGNPLPNSNGFTDFLSNFPFVENFFFATTYKCNNLKFSSRSLRTLLVDPMCDFKEIEFNTPNLVLFGYPCSNRLLCPLANLKACMQCYPEDYIDIDTLWFLKLRQFLDKKNGFKVLNLYIQALYSQKFKELERLKAIVLPPYELERVELQLERDAEPLAHIAFVEAVIWCCRPRSLTLRSSFPFEEQSDVVKFTYEKLLQQEDQGHTNVQIVSPSSSSLLTALPHKGKAISFIKDEVVQG